jgi:hypothetical protein
MALRLSPTNRKDKEKLRDITKTQLNIWSLPPLSPSLPRKSYDLMRQFKDFIKHNRHLVNNGNSVEAQVATGNGHV